MAADLVTDLAKVKDLGERARDENERFRRFLKIKHHSDRQLRHRAEAIEARIDCGACANCCRVATAKVEERDLRRLAKHLRLGLDQTRSQYTIEDEDEGTILRRTDASGCVFLDGTTCTVYEARPDACQRFPHLVRGRGSLASRMWQFIDRAVYCPIVYNSLEAFKEMLAFRR